MKAIVQDRYGSADVLKLQEIDMPVVADDEVLVRVRAASVHPDVWHVLTGLPYVLRIMGAGLRKPRNPVPGTDVAGIVESVGAAVKRFQPGDEVFGETIRGAVWQAIQLRRLSPGAHGSVNRPLSSYMRRWPYAKSVSPSE